MMEKQKLIHLNKFNREYLKNDIKSQLAKIVRILRENPKEFEMKMINRYSYSRRGLPATF